MSRKGRRSGPRRSYTPWIILVLVVTTGVVGYYIYTSSGAASGSPLNGKAVSQNILAELAGVSETTMNQVGSGASGVSSPVSTTSTAVTPTPVLTSNGKPEVLYIGAEYCPFCAAERWAMIVALDKFGNFTGIEYMQSASAPEIYPNTPTFTFKDATYSSKYISFVSYEQVDRNHLPLQTPDANSTALLNKYDSAGSIPFVDFGNQYILTGSQYTPPVLANANWTQIASQLNTPGSAYALNIDAAANRLISIICKIDGGSPTSLCSQALAQTAAYVRPSPSSGSQLLASDAVLVGPAPSTGAARFAPIRLTDRV
jgi:Domain of unknown function (DUF929)